MKRNIVAVKELVTLTLDTVIPGPPLTVMPDAKLLPFSVWVPPEPWFVGPNGNPNEIRVGGGGLTVNVTALLVPPASVTVMFRVPRALLFGALARVNVAVAVVEFVTTTLLT